MTWEVTAQPTAEPLTLTDVKLFLNLTSNEDDPILEIAIKAAREWAEKVTGRALLTQTVKQYWDKWPTSWELGISPAVSVTSIKYLDEDGVLQTWATTNYTADVKSMPARIFPTDDVDYPALGNYPNAVVVQYQSGYTTPADVPADMRLAMLQKIAFVYENREDIPINDARNYRVRSADNLIFNNRMTLI